MDDKEQKAQQMSMFGDPPTPVSETKKLKLDAKKAELLRQSSQEISIDGIPQLLLPTRWEQLQPKIENNTISLRTIIKPVPEAIDVLRDINRRFPK